MISIIVAVGKNNCIGKGGAMPWHLPADLKHFREKTSGHPVVMGRKTFESIGKPLPNRENIVITRDKNYFRDGVKVSSSLEEALSSFKNIDGEIFIIGGGETYKQALPLTDKLYITEIEKDFEGDTFFPEIDKNIWQEISREVHQPDPQNPLPYTFLEYKRK